MQIENMAYPITIEALHTVFSPYGNVQKITIFEKNGLTQVRHARSTVLLQLHYTGLPSILLTSTKGCTRVQNLLASTHHMLLQAMLTIGCHGCSSPL